MSDPPGLSQGLRHHALLYDSDEELADVSSRFAREGLAADRPVLAITGERTRTVLRAGLGADEEDVSFLDPGGWYGNPGRALAGLEALIDEYAAAGVEEIHLIGEVPFGASGRSQWEWMRYESALNDLFATAPICTICTYDTRTLPAEVTASAERTHPRLATVDGWRYSERYTPPATFLREVTAWEREHATLLEELTVQGGLARVRAVLRQHATSEGMSPERAEQFVNAVNEVITNAVTHGAQPVHLRVLADGHALMCDVSDRGAGVDDPLSAYRLPSPNDEQEGGRGLWLARQLCDVVDLDSHETGFSVHLAVNITAD